MEGAVKLEYSYPRKCYNCNIVIFDNYLGSSKFSLFKLPESEHFIIVVCESCTIKYSFCVHKIFGCSCEENKKCRKSKCKENILPGQIYCDKHKSRCWFYPSAEDFNTNYCTERCEIPHRDDVVGNFNIFSLYSKLPGEINIIIYKYFKEIGYGGCQKHQSKKSESIDFIGPNNILF